MRRRRAELETLVAAVRARRAELTTLQGGVAPRRAEKTRLRLPMWLQTELRAELTTLRKSPVPPGPKLSFQQAPTARRGGEWAPEDDDEAFNNEDVVDAEERFGREAEVDADFGDAEIEIDLVGGEVMLDDGGAHVSIEVNLPEVTVTRGENMDGKVDKGNEVRITMTFRDEPESVFFSYLRPGSRSPVVDEGYGAPGSLISKLSQTRFQYVIDTTGMKAGPVEWHFWSEGPGKASRYGSFSVNAAPAQLL